MFVALGLPAHFFTGYFVRGPSANTKVPSLTRKYAQRHNKSQRIASNKSTPQRNASTKSTQSARTVGWTDNLHTLESHVHLLTLPSRSAVNGRLFVPTRVPSWISLTHPIIVSIVNLCHTHFWCPCIRQLLREQPLLGPYAGGLRRYDHLLFGHCCCLQE